MLTTLNILQNFWWSQSRLLSPATVFLCHYHFLFWLHSLPSFTALSSTLSFPFHLPAYSSQDVRRVPGAWTSFVAHWSAIVAGTAASKTPVMGWACPTSCAYWSLATQCHGPTEQIRIVLDTAHSVDCDAANISVSSLEHLPVDRTAHRQLTCARTFC